MERFLKIFASTESSVCVGSKGQHSLDGIGVATEVGLEGFWSAPACCLEKIRGAGFAVLATERTSCC